MFTLCFWIFVAYVLIPNTEAVSFAIPAGPLRGRKCSEHAAETGKNTGNSAANDDLKPQTWRPKCLPDGTYAATQFNLKTGLKFCVSKEGILLVAPQRSLSDCDCPRKRFEKFQSGNFTGYIHRCDTDFTYSVQQYDKEKNTTYCLMKDGEMIQEYSGPHIHACKCPRQWYEAKISPLPNRYGPQCNPDGTFKPKQCHNGLCWCANNEGEQISSEQVEQSSPAADALQCV